MFSLCFVFCFPNEYIVDFLSLVNLRMKFVCKQTDTQPFLNKNTQPLMKYKVDEQTQIFNLNYRMCQALIIKVFR